MNQLVGVYGAGGCGRGIMPLLRTQLGKCAESLVFIDDHVSQTVNGNPVWTWRRFLEEETNSRAVCIAIASSRVRERLYQLCLQADIEVIGARATSVIEMDDVEVGPGALLSPFVTLTSNIRIGRCFHANLYSYVEHDCRIGDFVTFAPAVHCNGNVHIGDHAYIGAGSVIKQGESDRPLVIGAGAIVGMGAVVTKDVPAGATVVGNPARPHQKR